MYQKAIETRCIHGGYEPKNNEPRVLPIAQSTAYYHDSAQELAELFSLERPGYIYTRINNPTVSALEQKVAALEKGTAALATSSGQAATMNAILTICGYGDHFIATSNLYGGTVTLFTSSFKKMGIEVSFIPYNATREEISKEVKDNTKLIFCETLGNPSAIVADLELLSSAAHENGLPLFVDNTLATPYLCNPIDFGADVVIHSSTKYLDGHALAVGGIIVDSGRFDWKQGHRFNLLTDKDPSYHGLSYTETFKELAFITKARVAVLRDFGNCISPFNAFLTNVGIETLALRMQRTSENALSIARYLKENPRVSWVHYSGLEDDSCYKIAKKYLLKGQSGLISFGIKGGLEAGRKFIDSVKVASLMVHIGDVRTCVIHPASTTHSQLTDDEKAKAGVSEDSIRVSVGIENIEDLIGDFEQALAKAVE